MGVYQYNQRRETMRRTEVESGHCRDIIKEKWVIRLNGDKEKPLDQHKPRNDLCDQGINEERKKRSRS